MQRKTEKNSRVVFSAKTLLHNWNKGSYSNLEFSYKKEIVKHFFTPSFPITAYMLTIHTILETREIVG